MLTGIELLVALILGHFIGDFVFQNDTVGILKNRNRWNDKIPKEALPYLPPWWIWMTSHAAVHMAIVWWLTGSMYLGLFEFVAHFFTDVAKCEGKIKPLEDQGLHILSKVIIFALVMI